MTIAVLTLDLPREVTGHQLREAVDAICLEDTRAVKAAPGYDPHSEVRTLPSVGVQQRWMDGSDLISIYYGTCDLGCSTVGRIHVASLSNNEFFPGFFDTAAHYTHVRLVALDSAAKKYAKWEDRYIPNHFDVPDHVRVSVIEELKWFAEHLSNQLMANNP